MNALRHDWFALRRVHRAIVDLPDDFPGAERGASRLVLFEVTGTQDPGDQLLRLLAVVWAADTISWEQQGLIYNIDSARDRFDGGQSLAPACMGDLQLFDSGCGSEDCGVGAELTHYWRAKDIDLFVRPNVAARLRLSIAAIERLYALKTQFGQAVKTQFGQAEVQS